MLRTPGPGMSAPGWLPPAQGAQVAQPRQGSLRRRYHGCQPGAQAVPPPAERWKAEQAKSRRSRTPPSESTNQPEHHGHTSGERHSTKGDPTSRPNSRSDNLASRPTRTRRSHPSSAHRIGAGPSSRDLPSAAKQRRRPQPPPVAAREAQCGVPGDPGAMAPVVSRRGVKQCPFRPETRAARPRLGTAAGAIAGIAGASAFRRCAGRALP